MITQVIYSIEELSVLISHRFGASLESCSDGFAVLQGLVPVAMFSQGLRMLKLVSRQVRHRRDPVVTAKGSNDKFIDFRCNDTVDVAREVDSLLTMIYTQQNRVRRWIIGAEKEARHLCEDIADMGGFDSPIVRKKFAERDDRSCITSAAIA